MSVSLSSGHKIQEVQLGNPETKIGLYEREVPVDFEVLAVGTKGKIITLFIASKFDDGNTQMKKFLVHPSEEKLPKDKFATYYFYRGTIVRLGLHIFEVV